jgi:hypothetical protein
VKECILAAGLLTEHASMRQPSKRYKG